MSIVEILKERKGVLVLLMLTPPLVVPGHPAEAETGYSIEYYASFSGYQHPVHPVQQISKEEATDATARRAYYVAYFDEASILVKFTKMLDGLLFFEYRYQYYPDGVIMRAEVTNRAGVVRVLEFDKSGHLQKK